MAVEVEHVTVRFGGNTVLDDVSLAAPDGRITALIGPNGGGKTTLFNVITGVQKPQAGTVRLAGRDVTQVAPHVRVRGGLGRTFQRLELFGTLTVRENLRTAAASIPRRRRSAAVEEMIERLALGQIAEQRCDTLPTGSGRVVELARALMRRPAVVLLDEPASGQDEEESARFSALLVELAAGGLTVLLVEHDMDLVMRISDHVHVLDFGRLIASGAPHDIVADPVVQAAYLGAPGASAADTRP